MTKEEIFDLTGDPTPVKLRDGSFGLFLVYPIGTGDREGLCGVQVPGEEEHRWVHHDNLMLDGGALVENIDV